MVMGVLDKAFDVLVLKLGVVKRVYCEVRQSLPTTQDSISDWIKVNFGFAFIP